MIRNMGFIALNNKKLCCSTLYLEHAVGSSVLPALLLTFWGWKIIAIGDTNWYIQLYSDKFTQWVSFIGLLN